MRTTATVLFVLGACLVTWLFLASDAAPLERPASASSVPRRPCPIVEPLTVATVASTVASTSSREPTQGPPPPAAPPPEPSPRTVISGRVVDASGLVAPGACVTLLGRASETGAEARAGIPARGALPVERQVDGDMAMRNPVELASATTGDDGRFRLECVAPIDTSFAELSLVARKDRDGRSSIARLAVAGEELAQEHELVLVPLHSLSLQVRAATGSSIEATVSVWYPLPDVPGHMRTVEWHGETRGGGCSLDVASGEVVITIEAPGHACSHRELLVAGDEAVVVVLGIEAAISGRLVGPDGAPVSSASIEVSSLYREGETNRDSTTAQFTAGTCEAGPDGRFSIRGLEAGRDYQLVVLPMSQRLLTVDLACSAPDRLGDIRIGPAGVLSVEVHGAVPEGENVEVAIERLGESSWELESALGMDAGGNRKFGFTQLRPGRYRAWSRTRGGFAGPSAPVEVLPGEEMVVVVELGPTRTVTGRLVRAAAPSAGFVSIDGPDFWTTEIDASGRFSVEVPEGASRLHLAAKGGYEGTVDVPAAATALGDVRLP